MTDFQGKVALVTGATRGIGRAVAQKLAQSGAFVVGTSTTAEGAESITEYLKAASLQGMGVMLDVADSDQVDQVLRQLSEQEREPSILVNNAATTADNLLLRMDDDDWYRIIEINLNSVFRITRACVKSMFRARWGRIITMGSVVGFSGNSGQANYTAAKAGVVGFSKSLAQEIASRGVTVNVVAPGFIDTDMTSSLPDLVKQEMLKRIPMKRFGQPDEIASVVEFLASDASKYITGETIHVNGGMYMN